MTVDLGTVLMAAVLGVWAVVSVQRAPNALVSKMLDRLNNLTTAMELLVAHLDKRPCSVEVQRELADLKTKLAQITYSRSNGAEERS